MEGKFDFEDLLVYQKSLDYIDFVYRICDKFPKKEQFVLTSNFLRAAQSVAFNIAEGSGGTKVEFRHFIRTARRSVRECMVCTTVAIRQKYINEKEEKDSRVSCVEISKMLSGLMKSLG